jgi:Ca2+/H+ antiporter
MTKQDWRDLLYLLRMMFLGFMILTVCFTLFGMRINKSLEVSGVIMMMYGIIMWFTLRPMVEDKEHEKNNSPK